MEEYIASHNDFSSYEEPGVQLTRIDNNGTHYYADLRCPKCGGKGYINCYSHIDGGVCYHCMGSGNGESHFKVYTEEYGKIIYQRRKDKRLKEAAENNIKFFRSLGFSDKGSAYVVLGDTYAIREELKSNGARYNSDLGWFFNSIKADYPTYEINVDTHTADKYLFTKNEFGEIDINNWSIAKKIIQDKQDEYKLEHTTTEFLGSAGDKLTVKVNLVNISSYVTQFNHNSKTIYIYSFKDEKDNTLIWKTSTVLYVVEDDECINLKAGDTLTLKGTVKEHSTYKGVRQTVLTRCTVVEK